MKTIYLFFTFFITQIVSQASIGKIPVTWGKFSDDELKMKVYNMDSSASAAILYKFGSVSYEVINGELTTIYECIIRIKILSKAGFEYGNIELPYIAKDHKEHYIELKAHTINLDKDGKIQETNVSNDLFIDEDINGYYHNRKFAFPDLREGSIVEYYYKLKSEDFYFLRKWDFQDEIPIAWSEYRTYIPEIFTYRVMTRGMEGMNKVEHDNERMTFVNRNSGGTENINVDITRYVMENVKALHFEPYSISPNAYFNSLSMQLQTWQTPGDIIHTVINDWDDLSEKVLEASWFGDQFKNYSFAKDVVEEISLKATSKKEKIEAIYNYVKDNISWDGYYSLYLNDLKNNFKTKSGSSSEINSILLCILRSADIEADPVLICTKEKGQLQKAFSFINQFNHMVVIVKNEGQEYILDATDPFRPMSLQSVNMNNIPGFIVLEKKKFKWTDLKKAPLSKSSFNYFLTLDKENKLKGTVNYSCNNYEGLSGRKAISKKGLNDFFAELIRQKSMNIKSDSVTMQNFDSIKNNLVIKSNITTTSNSGDKLIYITPFINAELHSNPFKEEERLMPVEFYYPINSISTMTIQLPEGCKASELPKSVKVSLPDSAASFTFIASSTNNMIQLKSILTIERLFYPAEEYANVREFFGTISRKFSEQIVLSKE